MLRKTSDAFQRHLRHVNRKEKVIFPKYLSTYRCCVHSSILESSLLVQAITNSRHDKTENRHHGSITSSGFREAVMMQAKKIDIHYPFTITENSVRIPLTISQTSIHITQNSSEYLMVMLRARFPSCEVQIWYILLNKSTYFITEEGKKSRSREKR